MVDDAAQIDTRNRDGSMAKPGDPFVPGPVPKSAQGRAPTSGADAVYSGLLECPCTDRIGRKVVNASAPFGDTADGVLTYEGRLMPPNPPTFSRNCAPWPTGELLSQHNPTCDIRTYQGGLRCCPHEGFLLDHDQAVPDDVLEYRFKVKRFYFQPHDARKHEPVWRWGFSGSPGSDEYDIPKCAAGTAQHRSASIRSSRTSSRRTLRAARPRASRRDRRGTTSTRRACKPGSVGFKPVHLGGHRHAPACLSMELYNDDTGELGCRHVPTYGTKVAGATGDHRFDEKGYLALPPCVWGSAAQGLPEPPLLLWETRLRSVKRVNNTYAHTGEMALWQGHGVLAMPPEPSTTAVGASPQQMNPHPYRIANPVAERVGDRRRHRGESFDVYGPKRRRTRRVAWLAAGRPAERDRLTLPRQDDAGHRYEVDIVRQARRHAVLRGGTATRGWMYSSTMVAPPTTMRRSCPLAHGAPLPRRERAPVDASSPALVDGVPTGARSSPKATQRAPPVVQGVPPAYEPADPVAVDVGERADDHQRTRASPARPRPASSRRQPRKSLAPRGADAPYNGILEAPVHARPPRSKSELRAPRRRRQPAGSG